MTASSGPLSGIRVVDLTHILNGPFCTMLLGHMGAEVVKIEYGPGDRYRHAWMPVDADHDGYEFRMVNANKKAITLNLKHEQGKRIFLELVRRADVVVENFSIGVMDRLGLGYDNLRSVNPRVIYACSRGFGEDGPRATQRANAATIMAISGWVAEAWTGSGAPGTKVLGIGDEASGISMALGIVAALYARRTTGVGQKIEVSMQEALLGMMASSFHTLFEAQNVGSKPTRCADGYLAFHTPAMTDELFEHFATEMGHPEAIHDPRYATFRDRRANFDELEAEVQQWVLTKTRAEMSEVFIRTRISAAPVMSLAEVVEDPHLNARGAFVDIDDPHAGKTKLLRPWIRFSETTTRIRNPAPAMGEHNREIYQELLGYTDEKLVDLEQQGVI